MTADNQQYIAMRNWRHIMNELIYDRTQADVTNDTSKGQYNPSDLNRVEEYCRYLADELNSLGYNINITTKTNWTNADMRYGSEMTRIKNNILALMNGYRWITPIYSSVDNWNYQKANRWEQILHEILEMMSGMRNWYVYGNVARCGQNRLWQHRFRDFYFAPIDPVGEFITTENDEVLMTENNEPIETTIGIYVGENDNSIITEDSKLWEVE